MTDEAYNRRMRRSQHRRDAKRRLVRYCSTLKVEITMLIVVATVGAFLLAWVFSKTKINDWLALPVTLIVILVFTYATSRHLTDPLVQMRDAAERLSDGDYTARVPDFSNKYDEVGQLARAFNDMAEELQHEDQLRRDMIANVAHELRTPVSALQAMVENMADGVVEPNEKNMESILAQTHRLTDLISFLLDLSRIEAGSSSLNIEEFNFADFIDETIAPLKLLDGSRGHDIETHIPSNSVMEGDVDRLRQLYTNIIANALKHSLDDASVLVEAHVDDSRGTVVTNIVNFGSQIPEDVRHKIFQRFVMGITTRGSESGGTGLGLSIAKWAATLHGGSIHVVDDSRGVDFEIVLPLHPDVEGTGPRKQ